MAVTRGIDRTGRKAARALPLSIKSVIYIKEVAPTAESVAAKPAPETAQMADDYAYPISQCDVLESSRSALQAYRDKRRQWLSWIDTDEHHAIWDVISSMVWRDAAFNALRHFAVSNESNALNNPLLGEALIDGHVAMQVLAIRRLVDNRNDVISLRRLLKDLRSHFVLFTRENCVCFDGLPYDYEAVQQREMTKRIEAGGGPRWGERSGPNAHATSQMMHKQFDELAGIDPANRLRADQLPISLLVTIEKWLVESDADGLAKWSHAFLAHAGGPEQRERLANQLVTANKITGAIKAVARVTEGVSRWLLFASGRTNALMPVAQFNPFEKLDVQIMEPNSLQDAWNLWHQLSAERDRYLDEVDGELTRGSGAPKP